LHQHFYDLISNKNEKEDYLILKYSVLHIASLLNAEVVIHHDAEIKYLLTDSRRISFPEATLFFALHTARRNGHDFIQEVYDRGVKNFVVEKKFDAAKFKDANFIKVDDTLKALQQLASAHRAKFSYPVIGITGSNGKTIVKEWLYQLLSPDFNIARSPRSYNSQIGVPLSVWQMSKENDLAIFEAGISLPDEMMALKNIIQPTIGIFTNIGEAHKEGFTNNLEKAKEKAKLFANVSTLFCNADDDIIKEAVANLSANVFSYGKNENALLKIISINKQQQQTHISASYQSQDLFINIPFTDDASVENAIVCLCVMLFFKVDISIIAKRMKSLQAVDMRLQLIKAINDCAVINDSYSFDINSFNIALSFLLQQHQQHQKTVIISDFNDNANDGLYKDVAAVLHSKNIHRVIAIGNYWNNHQHLLSSKIAVTEFHHSTENFIQQFNSNNFKNEAILLKGARVFGFERIVSLLEKKVHQTVMEINLTALAHNLKQYQQMLRPNVKMMVMVKAFGYGSGSAEVANVLQFHKVDYLAVAYADEGVDLRNAGITLPILVMNVDEAAFETIIQRNLEPELFSFNIFQSFVAFLNRQGLQQYPVHIKLDTGMHRLGFEEKDIPKLIKLIKSNSSIIIKSVFSHLAASEDKNEDAFTQHQSNIFERCCEQLQNVCDYKFIRHIANSAAIFRQPQMQFDMVRLGIGLYGIDTAFEQQLSLQTVAVLKSTIAQLRKVKTGDTIGYNRKGKVVKDSVIATIRIGYADGFSRKLGNGVGKVFIKNKFAPVIGSVCMDMTMIDVTEIENIEEGNEVEILGNNVSIHEFSKWCGTIPYEILTNISQRVKRVYIEE
jgi:Alr-MurF fusion protein